MASLQVKIGILLLSSVAWQCPIRAQDLSALLANFVSESDRAKRELILFDISEHHPDAGPALLKFAIETENTEMKWLVIRCLGWLKYKEAGPFLREALRSTSNYVRANAARALGEIHDVSAVSDLVNILAVDKNDGVLEQTSSALLVLDAKSAIPALKARSDNPSAQTRLWIIGAIDVLGSEDVPFFATFLVDENDFVAGYAAHAIERITKEDFGFPDCGGVRGGPCSFGDAILHARQWWNSHNATNADSVLNTKVPEFNLNGETIEVGLKRLASGSAAFAMGFEHELKSKQTDLPIPDPRLTLHLKTTNVREALDAMCRADSRYTWSTDDTFINVYPIKTVNDASYLLNRRLLRLELKELIDIQQGLLAIVNQLPVPREQVAIAQIGGDDSYPPEPWTTKYEGLTVRQAINGLVRHMGERGSWAFTGSTDFRAFAFNKQGFLFDSYN